MNGWTFELKRTATRFSRPGEDIHSAADGWPPGPLAQLVLGGLWKNGRGEATQHETCKAQAETRRAAAA